MLRYICVRHQALPGADVVVDAPNPNASADGAGAGAPPKLKASPLAAAAGTGAPNPNASDDGAGAGAPKPNALVLAAGAGAEAPKLNGSAAGVGAPKALFVFDGAAAGVLPKSKPPPVVPVLPKSKAMLTIDADTARSLVAQNLISDR